MTYPLDEIDLGRQSNENGPDKQFPHLSAHDETQMKAL